MLRIHPAVVELCRREDQSVDWNAVAFFSAVMMLCQAEYREGRVTVAYPRREVSSQEFLRVSGLRDDDAVLAAGYIGLKHFPLSLRYTSRGTVEIAADWERVEEVFRSMESHGRLGCSACEAPLPVFPARDGTASCSFPKERYTRILHEYAQLRGIQLRQLPHGQVARARAVLKRLFRTGASDDDILRGLYLLHELARYRPYFRNWSIPTLEQHWQRYISGDLERELEEARRFRRPGKATVSETIEMLKAKVTHD